MISIPVTASGNYQVHIGKGLLRSLPDYLSDNDRKRRHFLAVSLRYVQKVFVLLVTTLSGHCMAGVFLQAWQMPVTG